MMKIARECERRGHQVRIYTLRWEAPMDAELDVQIVPISGLNRHTQYEHFAKAVREAVTREKFDLVVGFNKMPGLDVYYAGDSCYMAKALSQRSVWYRLLPRFKSFHKAEKAVFDKRAKTEILTLSDVEIPLYRQHYATPPERFHALPPGIEKDRVAPDNKAEIRHAFRASFGLDERDLVVLFIGSGFIKKGLDRALLAVAALPADVRERVHMFVVGRDHGEAFERMTMRLGLSHQVTFFTEGRDDVPRFLFSADALIHPAYDETAGMVIIEAMLAGLPAVVTKNCGYAKYLSEHDAGIVLPTPYSQSELDAALYRLLTSPQRSTWQANGLAAKDHSALFELVPKSVDYLERFARGSRPLLVFTLFRYFPYGGLQRDFMRIAQAAVAKGYDVLVYCVEWLAELPDDFQVIVVEVSGVANHTRYASFAKFVLEDVSWRAPAALIGFNRMPGLDLYYAADSCFEHKAQNMRTALYRRTDRYKVMSEFERAVFGENAKTHVMLISRNQAQQYQQYYHTPSSRLSFLPPGVSADRMRSGDWQNQRRMVREEFAVAEDEFLLLQVGSGFITKGLDRVLTMLAGLPQDLRVKSKLLVIGQDNPRQFLRLAKSLGVDTQLTILKGRDDIPAVLQGADLMVHPAYMESGGMVLIEAIIAGLPVIASGACGFAHFIDDAQAGVVLSEPFAQAEFEKRVVSALKDPRQRQQWSNNGVQFGRSHEELYDMPAHALRVIDEYVAQHKPKHDALAEPAA